MKNLTKFLVLCGLILLGTGHAGAYKVESLSIYYDNSASKYSDVSAIWGHGSSSQAHHLTNIPNTKLWYNTWNNKWDNYTDFRFLEGNWSSSENNSPYTRVSTYASNFTGCVYNVDLTGARLFKGANANKNCTLSQSSLSNGYSDLNKKQTVKVMVKATGQSSYVETTTFCGTITASRYTMTNASTAGSSSKTLGDDNYASGVLTSTISFAESNTTAGFTFKGWGTSSGSPATTDHTYSYTVDGEKTIYVFYEFDINVLQATSTKSSYYLHTWGDTDAGADFYKTQLANFYIIDNGSNAIDFQQKTGFGFKNGGKDGNWVGGGSKTIAQGNTWYTGVYASNNGSITKANMTYVSYIYFYYDGSSATTSAIYLAKGYNGLTATKAPSAGSASDPTISKNYVTQGQSVDVTAKTATSGYHFVNWTSSNGSFGNNEQMSTTFTPSANNAQAVANYTKNTYNLSYTGSNIASCNLPSTGIFEEVITVSVTAEDRYVITEINGVTATDITGLNTQSVSFKFAVPASNVQISFTTALGQVNLNYGINDGNHGTLGATINSEPVSSGSKIDGGSDVYFTATVNAGYHIEGWYSDDQYGTKIDESVALTRTVKANDDVNVYVKVLPNTYKVTFNKNTGTGTTMTDQNFTYNVAQNLTTNTYTKTGYRFLGWDINKDAITAQYTDGQSVSNLTTVNDGTVTLYAIWEQKMYNDIAVASNNTDMGTVNQSSVSFGYTTPSASITATPKAGYYFTGWTLPTNATYASGSQTNTTITVKAAGDAAVAGTITANFAERWVLRGSETASGEPTSGMPGWSTTDAIFTFAADATEGTKTVTLLPNREYKFMVYDRKHNAQRGYSSNTKLDANVWSGTMNGNMHLLMNTAGYGTYTFKVKENGDYPQIYITNPTSHLITMNTKTYSDGNASGDTGGTLTAKTTEGGQDFDISDGKYVRNGGAVVFTATPKTGYTFAGFYSDANCTGTQITEGVVDNKYTATISANKAVYAKFTENLTPVTVWISGDGSLKKGDADVKSGTVIKVGVYSWATLTPTPGSNYKFDGWTTSTGADFHMDDNTLKGNGAGRTDGQILNANFGEEDKIYFLNKKFDGQYQWTDVHVYFDAYWDDTNGAGANGRTHVHMNRIANTDIWWAYVPSNFTGTNVAFSQEDMNNYNNFDRVNGKESHGVYRNDFKKAHNMYIPKDNGAKHNCYYFSNGYWMKYDPTASANVGYYLKRNTDGHQYGEFKATDFTKDGTLTSAITISVDKNETQYLYVVSAGAENYADSQGLTKDKKSTVLSKYESNPSLAFTPNGVGDYTFRLIQGNGLNMSIEVVYPANDGDYRVIYNNGTKDHPSQAIKGGDSVSFFVKHNAGNFRIQKYNSGSWSDQETGISIPGEITADGVYVFKLASDGESLSYVDTYKGNYYIRTDVAAGGWHNYKGNPGNLMTKGTIYGYEGSYDYAYTNWAGQNTIVKFTVANDYSYCISDSLVGDDVLGEGKDKLETEGANIRFMWNSQTNELKRDYIGGSNDDKKFLLIHGSNNADAGQKTKSKLYEIADAASPIDSAKFHDDGNWIYSKEFYVEPGAYIALTAHFNDKTQFFHGAGNAETGAVTTYEQFVGGSGENRLKMKVIYNFKTNELVAGYIPDGSPIATTIDLNSDLLWIRTQQGDATPINFSSTAYSITNIHKIYGVLEFCKDSMTNLYNGNVKNPLTSTSYNRINYWISFPFDVRVSEIFGVDGYGEKWVIQYYNGERRAEIGWFAETSTFWEWLTLDSTMHAGKGYTLNIDPEYFDEPSDDIWKDVESKVAFYFPSAADYNVNVIKQQEVTTKIPDHEYYRSVKFENNPEKDHKITDSYWNIIGTPAFQPTTISTASSEKHGPKAVYVWKQGDGNDGNGYNIEETMTGFTFQPMRSYIVQYGGEVTWNSVSSIVKAQAPYAYADQKNYMVDLEFYFGEQRDHTYINLSDNATTEFKLNEDVMKMTNSGAPNIYSYAEGYDVAYNEVPMANQTINLGVIARKNGSYTFAMPKDFSGKAVLVDLEEGEATDLNLSNYTVELNKGTYNNRFQLMLEVEAKIPTNIDNVDSAPEGLLWNVDGKTKKLFINDQIYLINGGRVYNVLGVGE